MSESVLPRRDADGKRQNRFVELASAVYFRNNTGNQDFRDVPGMLMKVRDVIRRLTKDGWVQIAQKGSHRQFKHPIKPGKVTVPGKLSDDLPIGTHKSILRQAGLEE